MMNLALCSNILSQNNISEIQDRQIQLLIRKGYDNSLDTIKNILNNNSEDNLEFFFDYSGLEGKNFNKGLNELNSAQISSFDIKNIHYSFVYSFNNIGVNFNVSYEPINKINISKDDIFRLKILQELKTGKYKTCINHILEHVKGIDTSRYYITIEEKDKNNIQLEKKFFWAIIEAESEEDIESTGSPFFIGGRVTFIDPLSSKKVDASDYFYAPVIQQ